MSVPSTAQRNGLSLYHASHDNRYASTLLIRPRPASGAPRPVVPGVAQVADALRDDVAAGEGELVLRARCHRSRVEGGRQERVVVGRRKLARCAAGDQLVRARLARLAGSGCVPSVARVARTVLRPPAERERRRVVGAVVQDAGGTPRVGAARHAGTPRLPDESSRTDAGGDEAGARLGDGVGRTRVELGLGAPRVRGAEGAVALRLAVPGGAIAYQTLYQHIQQHHAAQQHSRLAVTDTAASCSTRKCQAKHSAHRYPISCSSNVQPQRAAEAYSIRCNQTTCSSLTARLRSSSRILELTGTSPAFVADALVQRVGEVRAEGLERTVLEEPSGTHGPGGARRAREGVAGIEPRATDTERRVREVDARYGVLRAPAVSYTHLTLPTICSV
eukprot:1374140-Rhodomonas_salina.2